MKKRFSRYEIWLAGEKKYRRYVWQKRIDFCRKHFPLIAIGATASFGSVAFAFWRIVECLR